MNAGLSFSFSLALERGRKESTTAKIPRRKKEGKKTKEEMFFILDLGFSQSEMVLWGIMNVGK